MRIRKGDKVQVIAGADKGKVAKVVDLDREAGNLTVEGVNVVTKHVRPNKRNPQGGRLEIEKPISQSNVMYVCEKCGKPTRLGARYLEDGSKERYCKKCNAGIGQIAPAKTSRAKEA